MRALFYGSVTVAIVASAGSRTAPAGSASPIAKRSEDECVTCHVKEVDQWRTSLHQTSFTSPDFQRSYHAEPRAYCVACHAPLPDREAGIGCVACHSVTDKHLAIATRDRPH